MKDEDIIKANCDVHIFLQTENYAFVTSLDSEKAKMIVTGYMTFLSLNELPTDALLIKPYQTVTLYIRDKDDHDIIIGEAQILDVCNLMYSDDSIEAVHERFRFVRAMYYDWCELKGIKPNHKEGWFSSKKFIKYRQEIGMYDDLPDYTLRLCTPIYYPAPIDDAMLCNTKLYEL